MNLEIELKRKNLIAEVESWDASWRHDGEPRMQPNRYKDDLIEHLEELPSEEVEAINDIYEYDYKGNES
jgi:hypothetical protein